MEISFESWGLEGDFMTLEGMCALYANGITTGISLDSGDSKT